MTAVQNLTKVFRAGHWQVRDLLQEVAVAFGDRVAGWASLISGWATSAWPGARPRDRRQGFVFISHLGTVHLSDSSRSPPAARAVWLAGTYRPSPLFTGLRDHGRLVRLLRLRRIMLARLRPVGQPVRRGPLVLLPTRNFPTRKT